MNGFFLLIPFFLIRFALLFFYHHNTLPALFNPGRSLYPEYTRGGLLWKPCLSWKT